MMKETDQLIFMSRSFERTFDVSRMDTCEIVHECVTSPDNEAHIHRDSFVVDSHSARRLHPSRIPQTAKINVKRLIQ